MALTAKPAYKYQDYLINATNAKPLTGYYVRIFNAGTSTPAIKYIDDTATIPDTTDITTNNVGFFSTFLAPDFYDVRFYSNVTDYTNNTNPVTTLTDVMIDGFTTTTASSTSFTPNGDIAANTVQTAIQEVRDEYKAADTTLVTTINDLQNQIDNIVTNLVSTVDEFKVVSVGQTLFTGLPTYIIGTNSVSVFINGVYQDQSTYTETSTTSITFDNTIPAGKEVVFKVQAPSAVNSVAFGNVTGKTLYYISDYAIETDPILFLATLIGSTDDATIILDAPTTLTNTGTVTDNIEVIATKKGIIDISNTKVLTIEGSFSAGRYLVFDGLGTVDFASIDEIYPEWWGAKADGVTDCAAAIQKAIDSIGRATGAITRGKVAFGSGVYLIDSQLEVDQQSIHFAGNGGTIIEWNGNNTTSLFHVDDSSNCMWTDIVALGKTTSQPKAFIHFDRTRTIGEVGTNEIHRVINCITGKKWTQSTDVDHYLQHGVLVDGADGNNDTVYIDRCQFNFCTSYGVRFTNAQSIWSRIANTLFNQCGTGIYAGCNMSLQSVYFNRNTNNDIVTIRQTQLEINDLNSENSNECFNFSGGADVSIRGSKITLSDGTSGSAAAGTYWLNATNSGNIMLENLLVSKAASMTTTGLMSISFMSLDNTALRVKNCRIPGLADKSAIPAIFPSLTKLASVDVDATTTTNAASTAGSGIPVVIKGVVPWADAYDITSVASGAALLRASTAAITTILSGDFVAGSYSKPLGGLLPKYSANYQAAATGRVQAVYCNKTVGAIDPDSGVIKYKKFYPNELLLSRTFVSYADPATALNAGSTTSHSVPGARLGDFVLMSRTYTATNAASVRWLTHAYVQAPDTVEIRWQNEDSGANTNSTTCNLNLAIVNPSIGLNSAADVTVNALADHGVVTGTITVAGANMGDIVLIALSADAQDTIITGEVSATNTVTYYIANESGGVVTINSGNPVLIKALVIPIL